MVHFTLSVVLIIGVPQMCTASAIVSDASDASKVYSENELQLAKNAGISDVKLVDGKRLGFTFEEVMKIHQLEISNGGVTSKDKITFEFMTKVCEIMDREHKTVATHTSVQETHLRNFQKLMTTVVDNDLAPFVRSTTCAYLSQPDLFDSEAKSFGLDVVRYMGIRYLKLKAQKVSGNERAGAATKLCCVYINLEKIPFLAGTTFGGFSDEELSAFGQQWTEFEAANTSKSLENVCEFLQAKNPDDQCEISSQMNK